MIEAVASRICISTKVYSSCDNSVDNEVVPATTVADVVHYVAAAAVVTASAAV